MWLRALPLPGRWRICAICDSDGKSQALDILRPGGPEDANASSKRQMWARLETVAQLQHPARNTTVSHQIDEESRLFEFIKGDLRLVYFYDEGWTIILSHGFIKDRPKTRQAEIDRGRKAVAEYFRAKRDKKLRYIVEQEEEKQNG